MLTLKPIGAPIQLVLLGENLGDSNHPPPPSGGDAGVCSPKPTVTTGSGQFVTHESHTHITVVGGFGRRGGEGGGGITFAVCVRLRAAAEISCVSVPSAVCRGGATRAPDVDPDAVFVYSPCYNRD